MMAGTLAEAAEILQGRLAGPDAGFLGVSTDTRTLAAGQLFFALRGPNFDGGAFLDQAADKAAAGAVVSEAVDAALPQIRVDDTLRALGELAADWRRRMPARIVGLTGSNGKTTLKEMLASCLARSASTLATEGNLNNEIGVPLMLARLSDDHVYAVIEMGANHAGEIAYLTSRAQPQVVVITNAGAAHLEGFGSIEGVARAKGEILQGDPRPDIAVLNADDAWFDLWRSFASDIRVVSFGTGDAADVRTVIREARPDGLELTIELIEATIDVSLPLAGRHNALNAAAAAATAQALGLPPATIRRGLESVQPVAGRLKALPGPGRVRLYDDSYNANPDSVVAAAEFLAGLPGEGWLVLGDMAELGPDAEERHRKIGEATAQAGILRLFATGPHMAQAVDAFGDGGAWFEEVDELIDALRASLPADRPLSLLVKGSRSSRMERVVHALAAAGGSGEGG